MSLAIRDAPARQKSGERSSQAANRQNAVNEEALLRLPTLDLGELRQRWRGLYKTQAPPNLSRELLVQAVAYRMQEVARGGLRPEPQRQLLRIAQQFKETGAATIRARPELKPEPGWCANGKAEPMRFWRSITASPGRAHTTVRCPPSPERLPARRGQGRCSLG